VTHLGCLERIMRYREQHGHGPVRVFVSEQALREMAPVQYAAVHGEQVGRNTFGAAEWYLDTTIPGSDVRIENADA
jgi:hypothetical protein